VDPGIYAFRCAPPGQCWAGSAPDLSTIQNRLWFTLRHGSNSQRALQDAWNTYGAEAFAFEIVERLEAEESAYIRDGLLKTQLKRWIDELGAVRI